MSADETSSRFATHSAPIPPCVPAVLLQARIGDLDDAWEQLWTRRVGEDRFEVRCIPFFVYDLALGDVVTSAAADDWQMGLAVDRSGHEVVRIAMLDGADLQRGHEKVHGLIAESGYAHEWFRPEYVAIDIPDGGSADRILSQLAGLDEWIEGYEHVQPSAIL